MRGLLISRFSFSASESTSLADQAVASGAQDYLVKGRISPEALRRSVRYAISRFNVEQTSLRLRAIEDFVNTLAHDLKVPIQAMERITRYLANGSDPEIPEPLFNTIKVLHSSNKNVLTRLENLIELYQYEFGSVRPFPSRVALEPIIQDVVSKCQRESTKEVAFELDFARIPPASDRLTGETDRSSEHMLVTDPLLFAKALAPVLDNAVKFGSDGTPIKISVGSDNGHYVVSVNNRGPVIPQEQVRTLFKKFWRGTPGVSYVASTGLGLYMTNQLIKLLRGKCACVSDSEGTTVSLYLPAK